VTGWTIFFMVLLRIAIGWHFFYEGVWKLVQDDWRATSYLVASSGPFRDIFRWMVDDVDGRRALTSEDMKARLDRRCKKLVRHYGVRDDDLKKKIQGHTDRLKNDGQLKDSVPAIYGNQDFQQQREDYLTLLDEIKAQEEKLGTTDYDKERLTDMYGRKARAKAAILKRAEAPLRTLDRFVQQKMDIEKLGRGAPPGEPSPTWLIDISNMWALTLVGVCLMLGLLTRLASLGGIGLLCLYYFAMPPFPGLPESPMAEGHYLIINKNLIEMIALLMIATSRIGCWGGIDAWIASRRASRKAKATQACCSSSCPTACGCQGPSNA